MLKLERDNERRRGWIQATREVMGNTNQEGSPRELPGTFPPPGRSIPPETVSSSRAGRDDGSWSVTEVS